MLKKVSDFLGGLPMTIAAGLFLLLELVPHLTEEFGGTPMDPNFLPFDPAWGHRYHQRNTAALLGCVEAYS